MRQPNRQTKKNTDLSQTNKQTERRTDRKIERKIAIGHNHNSLIHDDDISGKNIELKYVQNRIKI